jgi:hypothetical protein
MAGSRAVLTGYQAQQLAAARFSLEAHAECKARLQGPWEPCDHPGFDCWKSPRTPMDSVVMLSGDHPVF